MKQGLEEACLLVDRGKVASLGCALQSVQARARFSASVAPPCFSAMMWSMVCTAQVINSGIRQYSQHSPVLTDQPAQDCGDVCAAHGNSRLRPPLNGLGFGQADKMLEVRVAFPFPMFVGREALAAVLFEQLLHAVLQIVRGPPGKHLLGGR